MNSAMNEDADVSRLNFKGTAALGQAGAGRSSPMLGHSSGVLGC